MRITLIALLFVLVGCGGGSNTQRVKVIIYDTTWKTIYKDSIEWTVIKKDSIKWNTVNKDSIKWAFIYRDSTIINRFIIPIYLPSLPDSVNVTYSIEIQ